MSIEWLGPRPLCMVSLKVGSYVRISGTVADLFNVTFDVEGVSTKVLYTAILSANMCSFCLCRAMAGCAPIYTSYALYTKKSISFFLFS